MHENHMLTALPRSTICGLLLSLTWLVQALPSNAQIADNFDKHNETNIYYQALLYFCEPEHMDSTGTKPGKSDTIFVNNSKRLLDSLLVPVGNTTVVLVNDVFELIESRRWRAMLLYNLSPVRFENGEFIVNIGLCHASAKKKGRRQELMMACSPRCAIHFCYEKGRFCFLRKKT